MALKDIFRVKAANDTGLNSFITTWNNPHQHNSTELMGLYGGHVHACVSVIARNTAKINLRVNQQKSDGDLVEVPNHDFLKLINKPNPLQSKFAFLEMLKTYELLAGEAFVYMPYGERSLLPKEMYLLRPDRMAVAVDETQDLPRIAGYVYTKPNGTRIPLDPLEIFHHKLPNPLDPYRGLGVVEAGLMYILTEKYSSEFTRNYIYNNAMPAGVLNIKANVGNSEFNKIKKQFQQEYGSIKNAGKTAVMKGADVEFIKIGSNLSEVALKELKDMSRDDIMEMFGVSKPVLGITDDVNRANAEAAIYHFAVNVVDPAMFRLADNFQSLLDRFGSNLVLTYDSPIPASQDEQIAYDQAAVNSWETVNEVRARHKLDGLPGGDQLYMPYSVAPMGEPATPPDTTAKNTVTIRRTLKKKLVPVEVKENFRLELMHVQEKYERKFLHLAKDFIAKQKAEVISNLKVEVTKTKANGGPDYYFNFDSDNAEFQKLLQPLMTELISEQGKVALKFAGSDGKFELNTAVIKQIHDSVARMATNFNEQTRDALADQLVESINSGEPIEDITAMVEHVFSDARGYRAERIARTETLKGSNYATNEAYRQTGYVIKKEWYANPDACGFCDEMNGKVVGIDTTFAPQGTTVEASDGNTYALDYESVDTPPLHPNCRCTIIPVTESTVLSGND